MRNEISRKESEGRGEERGNEEKEEEEEWETAGLKRDEGEHKQKKKVTQA